MNGTAEDIARLLEIIRSGGGPLLKPATVKAMLTNHTGSFSIISGPGWGFGYGGAVLVDPEPTNMPQSPGTFMWGGVYGHNWFIDPKRRLAVIVMTNTAIEGMLGKFTLDIRDAVYGVQQWPLEKNSGSSLPS